MTQKYPSIRYVYFVANWFFAQSNYSEYKLSCDTCVGRMLLVVPEIQAYTSYYVAVAFAIHGAHNTEMNRLLWLQYHIIATCHGYKVSNAQGFKVQATVEKDQVKEIARLLNEDSGNINSTMLQDYRLT